MSNVPVSRLKPLTHRKLGTSSLTQHFGATALSLPKTLNRPRLALPDQRDTDFCTAYGEAVSSGFRWGIAMSAEWQTAMESRFIGYPIVQGADAGVSMDATILNASLPQRFCGFSLATETPGFIANWGNYDPILGNSAAPYPPGIPYKVDGPYDVFDNIRQALNQAWGVDKSVVKAFGHWYQSFNEAANNPVRKGMLSKPADDPITLHRYNFVDFDTIDGKEVLVAALTQGPEFGDNGYLYFDRETVNFIFSSLSEAGLGLYIPRPPSFNWPTTIAYFRTIISMLTLKVA